MGIDHEKALVRVESLDGRWTSCSVCPDELVGGYTASSPRPVSESSDCEEDHSLNGISLNYTVSSDEEIIEIEEPSPQQELIPPPFEPKDSDSFINLEPGQLVSYLYHPNEYRTGVLCSKDGKLRFCEKDDDAFFEGKFLVSRARFKKKKFRVRNDLKVGT